MVDMILLGNGGGWTLHRSITSQVGDQDSIVHNTGLGDTGLQKLLKDGFGVEHDFLPVLAAVRIAWILLLTTFAWILLFVFVFAYCIKLLNFQKKVENM